MALDEPKKGAFRPFPWAITFFVVTAATVFVGFCGATYLFRGKIAAAVATNWLREHGIASRVSTVAISQAAFSVKLSLGAPARPDLTVDRLDLGYRLVGPWVGQPFSLQVGSVRMLHPRLQARWDGAKLTFGALQPLIESLTRVGGAAGSQPDIAFYGAILALATPAGPLSIKGDGAFKGGTLAGINATLDPFHLASTKLRLDGQGGLVNVKQDGGRLLAKIAPGRINAVSGADRISVPGLVLIADLPKFPKSGAWTGAAHLTLAAPQIEGSVQGVRVGGGAITARLDGQMQMTAAAQRLSGGLALSSRAGSVTGRGVSAQGAVGQIHLDRLALVHQDGSASLLAGGTLGLDMPSLDSGGANAALHVGSARFSRIAVVFKDNRPAVSGSAEAQLSGTAKIPAAVSRRLIASTPGLSSEPAYASAFQQALRDIRFGTSDLKVQIAPTTTKLTFVAPLMATSASGAQLRIATPSTGLLISPAQVRGDASVTLEGGGLPILEARVSNASISASKLQADVVANGVLDLSFARRAKFAVNGRLSGSGRTFRFDLTSDASFNAQRLGAGANGIENFAVDLRPAGEPLFEVTPTGWTARGILHAVQGDMSGVQAGLRGADAAFEADGRSRLDRWMLTLSRGSVIDHAKPGRFQPLGLTGRVGLGSGVLTGDLQLGARAGGTLGTIHIRHDVASATGRAEIDAGALVFTPGGLQPADLSPLANFAKAVDGQASFKGWLSWAPNSPGASGGELIAKSLTFNSPAGPVLGVDTDIRFTSLSPLMSAPGQAMTVRLVQAVTPLSGLSAEFDFDDRAVSLGKAAAGVAKGTIRLEPMRVPLSPSAQVSGALVLYHVNIGDIIAASSLADTVKMDAVLDGRIPFTFGPDGLTVQQGRLQAIAPGRISISRKALTGGGSASSVSASDAQSGFGQDIAYQAMEDLAFDQLDASVDTQTGDRLGILFHIKGRHDPPQPQRATIQMADVLRGQPLAKPIKLPSDTKINLTLDTSLNFGDLVKALMQAWRDSLDGGRRSFSSGSTDSGANDG